MKKHLRSILMIAISFGLLVMAGCEGSDAKKAVTDAVKTVTGSELAKKGQEVQKQVDQSMKEEAKRLIKMDDQKKQKATEGEEESKNDHND